MLIYGHDAAIAGWVAERVPNVRARGFGKCVAIGVPNRDNTKLIAGVVFNDYFPEFGTMQLSMAADNPMWARREVIAELLRYPFKQVGVNKLWTVTSPQNTAATKVNEHIGFRHAVVLGHHFGPKRHAEMRSMLRHEWERLWS